MWFGAALRTCVHERMDCVFKMINHYGFDSPHESIHLYYIKHHMPDIVTYPVLRRMLGYTDE